MREIFVPSVRVVMLKLSPEGKARTKKCVRDGLCRACLRKAGPGRMIRGNHESCRRLQTIAIERGELNEETLIRDGKLLPPQAGRKPSNPVTIEARGGTVSENKAS